MNVFINIGYTAQKNGDKFAPLQVLSCDKNHRIWNVGEWSTQENETNTPMPTKILFWPFSKASYHGEHLKWYHWRLVHLWKQQKDFAFPFKILALLETWPTDANRKMGFLKRNLLARVKCMNVIWFGWQRSDCIFSKAKNTVKVLCKALNKDGMKITSHVIE